MNAEEQLSALKRLAVIKMEKTQIQKRIIRGDEVGQDWFRLEAEQLQLRRQLGPHAPAE